MDRVTELPRRKRLNREEKKAVTRRSLMDAALLHFQRHGFSGVSLEQLAEEAGFSRGAVYSNFRDKNDVLLALLDEHFEKRGEELAGMVASGATTPALTEEAGREFIASLSEDPRWVELVLELSVRAAHDDDLRRRFAEVYDRFTSELARLSELQAAKRHLRLTIDPRHVAMAILAMSHGIAVEKMLRPDVVPDRLFAEMLMPFLFASATALED